MDRLTRYSDGLFLTFLFLLPFQTIYLLREPLVDGEKWQYGTIGIYASAVVLALAMIFSTLSRTRDSTTGSLTQRIKGVWSDQKSDVLLVLFVLWAGLSVSWAGDRALAVYGFLMLLLAAGAYIMVQAMVRWGKDDRIVTVLILSAMIQALIGIWQFLSQETFASTLLGTSAHPVWQAGTSVLKYGTGRFLRAYGTFPHPNVYGLFLAMSLLLVIMRIIDMGGKPIAANAWKRAAHVAAIPILSFGLVVSYSRLAWAGCTLGILAYGAHMFRNSFKCHPGLDSGSMDSGSQAGMTRRYVFATVAAIMISAGIYAGILCDTIVSRFDGAVIAQEGSVTDRMTTYRDASRVIRESSVLGSGMWNETAELIRLDPRRPVWDIQPAHDVPLLVLTELGIPGLFLGILFFFQVVRDSLEMKNIALFAMLLVLLPSFLFDHFLWDSVYGTLFMAIAFGSVSIVRGLTFAEKKV